MKEIFLTDLHCFMLLKGMLAASFGCLLALVFLLPFAAKFGLIDEPGGRKWHEGNIPTVGGIMLFIGFFFGIWQLHQFSINNIFMLVGGAALIVLGILDDRQGLSPRARLWAQIFAGAAMILGGGKVVTNLGNLLAMGDIHLGLLSAPFTLLMLITFINASNMLDGQDGLAGGVAFSQVFMLLVLSVGHHLIFNSYCLSMLAVGIFIFLCFNAPTPKRKRALIFLGDAGSTWLAFMVGWFAIDIATQPQMSVHPMTVLWLLAYPLFDLLGVFFHRTRQNRSPLSPGLDHLHHLLHGLGVKKSHSTLILCGFSITLGAFGLVLAQLKISETVQLAAFVATLVLYQKALSWLRQIQTKPDANDFALLHTPAKVLEPVE